ncbi:glycosyl hydrolase family 28-related protein [Lichenicoccus sp.]|uniref:glycosyl hydrolase family 28-related protein n=1 Tax=Lichenicoccus sp. TaxID=2781899 RepID=UPI003D097C74
MAGLTHQALRAAVATICLGATAGAAQGPGRAIDVTAYGANGDGVTDDTLAFRAAIAAAQGGSAARNQGALIEIPCGKYILTARLTIHLAANTAIGLHGQTQSCTELQWNVADGGLDFEYPQQQVASASRNPSGASPSGPGAAVDIERLSLVNNAPGNVYTGMALLLRQPVPTHALASGGPDQTIRDVAWHSLTPGQGGSSAQGQAWNVGIDIVNVPYVHISHVTGSQYGSRSPFASNTSAGIRIESTGGPRSTFTQQIWLSRVFQQGAYDGLDLIGHNIQGVYADRLMELQNAYSVRWQAPSEDASASFFLSDSSLDGLYAGVSTNFVKQVFLTDNEILNGGPGPTGALAANYFGIRLRTTDDAMVSGNVLIPLCRACTLSQIAPGYTGTGIEVLHHAAADTQGSVIAGNSIDYGDVGISAGGSQVLVSGNIIAAGVPTPIRDDGIGATHPVFADNEVGQRLLPAPPTPIPTSAPLAEGGTNEAPATADGGAILNCAGRLSTFTWRLPPHPTQGQRVHLASECTVSRFTLQPRGQGIAVIGAPGTISPATPLTFIYDATNRIWTRW